MRRLAPVVLAAGVLLAPSVAAAQWVATAGGAVSVSASTMTNAVGFVVSCEAGATVRLTWTSSPDAYVEGYEILRSRPGVAPVAIRLPRATAGHLDTPAEAKGQEAFTYTYTIRAGSTQHAWTTPVLAGSRTVTLTKSSCTPG